VPNALIEFVKRQAPGAKYILSVCTGSWILAGIGLLDGKKATSNKSVLKALMASACPPNKADISTRVFRRPPKTGL
jgi:putative intracellular protease/amidase